MVIENQISEVLGALSDPELSGSGTKTSGIYPIFRTSVVSLIFLIILMSFMCSESMTPRQGKIIQAFLEV